VIAAGDGGATMTGNTESFSSSTPSWEVETESGERIDKSAATIIQNVLALWLTSPKTTAEAEERKNPILISKMLEILGQSSLVEFTVEFIKKVVSENHRD
jgi:hypothetical protein